MRTGCTAINGGRSFLYNIALVGDPGVGKTSILCGLTGEKSLESWSPVLPINTANKLLQLDGGHVARLRFWELSIDKEKNSSYKQYLLYSWGICLVFDVTNSSTFESILKFWLPFVKQARDTENIEDNNEFIYLIGTSSGITKEREVSRERAQVLSDEWQLQYFESTASNLESIFKCIAQDLDSNIV